MTHCVARPVRRGTPCALVGGLALVLAAGTPARAASLIDTSTVSAHYSASHFYTQYANGHYWAAFNKDNLAVLYSSRDGSTWVSQGTIFPFSFPVDTNYFAVRYRSDRIIALAFNAADNTRYYREGTLGSTGSVTWGAAPATAGPADATDPDLNALIANGRPVLWRAGLNGNGSFWRGSALTSPVWAALPGAVPAHGLSSGFTAGAVFPAGGPDPDDLIVLRAFTQTTYAAGNHRLLALKWNDALGAYDGSWYNVSTLGGSLTEGAATEVEVQGDFEMQRMFAAVADTYGNIHAVYETRSTRVAHYRKAVGFNDSWTRVTSDVLGEGASKLALSAAPNGNLILFYEKDAAQRDIWYRRFDGTSWGPETLVYPGAALGTDLRRALAPLERAVDCVSGVAFTTGSTPPFNVNFALGGGQCSALTTAEDASAGTITVTGLGGFEMVFTTAAGGSMEQLYDLVEDPGKTLDLVGSWASSTSPRGLHSFGMNLGVGINYNSASNDDGARLHLLEATSARVRLRQDAFYQDDPGGPILGGVKGYGDYSIYPAGKVGLRWERRVTDPAGVTYLTEYKELFLHRLGAGPLNGWVPYHDAGSAFPGSGLSAFLLGQNETAGTPGARTDILEILHEDWTGTNGYLQGADSVGSSLNVGAERINVYWIETNGLNLPDGRRDTWDSLTYIKPTTFVDHADGVVTTRSTDYRFPAAPGIMVGTAWQDPDENTASDNFNEAEAAYLFTLDVPGGLRFDLDGAATPRYRPFFKIRQWRSRVAPSTITFDSDSGGPAPATALVRGLDYQADVKPVSRAAFADDLLWYSTFESGGAVTGPNVGSGASVNGGTTFVAGRYGNAARFAADGDYVLIPAGADLDTTAGAVEFWYQPTYAHTDGATHILWHNAIPGEGFALWKQGTGQLSFTINDGVTVRDTSISSADYSWRVGDWVHIRAAWGDGTMPELWVNGARLPHTDTGPVYDAAQMATMPSYIGAGLGGGSTSAGTIDEFRIYSGTSAPTAFAHGGLTSSPSEYLAEDTRNFALAFNPVDAATTRRGEYAYFGSDSKFRGLNVVLGTEGTSAGTPVLQWQYWSGTGWANLAVTDETSAFTRAGTIYWTGDPFGWKPYSVNGGPDLYYVRVYMTNSSATYTADPVEAVITTDVLLFQYCADVTSDNQEFTFGAPVPTAVKIVSFRASPLDSAAAVEWATGSELDNLGFHVYRGLSADGPWARLTSSLIPGLGSSPLGQAYSWLDSGLVNGTQYYYRLEDVDTASVSTFHGPVSTVPSAPGEDGEGDGGGDGTERGGESEPGGSTSCPSWVLSAAPDVVSPVCTRHGDPDSVSLQILACDASSATLELHTKGFWALRDAAGEVPGEVRVFVPGLEFPSDPRAPALPLRRALVEAVVGKGVELVSAEAFELRRFQELRPAAVGEAAVVVGRDGMVRPGRRAVAASLASRGYQPRELARLAGTVFQGERKSAVVEITPVRFSGASQKLVLAGRVRVRLAFTGVVEGESGAGSRGRAVTVRRAPVREVLAQLHTSRRGVHAVRFEDLFPQGRRGFSTSLLRLQRQGEAVAFHVEPQGPVFGPGSVLYFFAERVASSTEYTSEVAYELVRSSGVGMGTVSAPPLGVPMGSSSTGFSTFETNRIYLPGLLEAADIWLWDWLASGVERTQGFTLWGVDTASPEPARLVVHLQGGSESGQAVDHHVRFSVNGSGVGETSFAGKPPQRVELAVPASLLLGGGNELGLTNVGDTGVVSRVYLDRFEVSYPQASTARQGVFEGVWAEGGTVEVGGLSGRPVILRDAGPSGPEGSAVRWLTGFQATGFSVRFQAEAGRRYVVVSAEGMLTPRIGRLPLSTLRDRTNQADYLVIAPREFVGAAQPLLERRRSQGLSSRAVAFEEIASEFGHAQPSAEAIREFLKYAWHSWRRPSPRYVLLLGDATDDPRRFQAASWPSPLPALLTRTSYLWTVSDPLLGAVNGEDGLPDLAIGRLPATTVEQAEGLVFKLLAWEETGQGLLGKAVLVADEPDAGGDFEADIEDIRTSFLMGRPTTTLEVGELGAAARGAILEAFDEGASLMSYVGHGGTAVWSTSNVLSSWDAPSLRVQSRQPVLLTWNCLNGYFVAPNLDALPEALLKAGGRGVVAAFSPSGLSLDGPAHAYHRAVMDELASGGHERLGDAIVAAQGAYAQSGLMPELLTVYELLGDPAILVR